jgi:hypothetical protein
MAGDRTRSARLAIISGLYGAVVTGSFYGFSVYSKALNEAHSLASTKHDAQLANKEHQQTRRTLPYCLGLLSPVIGAIAGRRGRATALRTLGI